jgi:hypothetical protein
MIRLFRRARTLAPATCVVLATAAGCRSSSTDALVTDPTLSPASSTAVTGSTSGPTIGGSLTTVPTTGDGAAISDGTSARASTSAAEPEVSRDATLAAAVRRFWDVYVELGSAETPFDAEATRARLAQVTTREELNRLLAFFSSNAVAGYVVRGTIDAAPVVVSLSDDAAQVRDCYDDRTGLYRVADGTRVDVDAPGRHQVLMTLALEDGAWKVATISDEGDACTG